MINLSYSRISLMDIAQKLLLDSPEDAEYIVAKVSIPAFSIKVSTDCTIKAHSLYFYSICVHNMSIIIHI